VNASPALNGSNKAVARNKTASNSKKSYKIAAMHRQKPGADLTSAPVVLGVCCVD
jgi:hypothetical protein